MALDPGTAYTNARKARAEETKGLMDMMSWKQLGEMRAQQMSIAQEDQQAKRWAQFYKEMADFKDELKAVDPAQRELFMKNRLRANGIDPKSEQAKEQIAFVKKASEETLNKLARDVAGIAANAPSPEEGEALVKGVMAGWVTPGDAQKTAMAWREQKRQRALREGKPSVAQSINMPVQTDRIANPVLAKNAAETAAGAVPPVTAGGSGASTFAPQIRGGIKAGTGMDIGPGAPKAGNPLEVATKAKGTMDSVFGPDSASRLMLDPTSAGSMGQMMGLPASGGGIDKVMGTIMQAESGGDPNAKNKRSSASGLFQYIDSTYLNSVERQNPAWAKGMTKREILATRFDPEKATEIARNDLVNHAARLEGKGIPATGGNIYMLHHFGPGATSLFREDPETPFASVVGKGVIKDNPQYADMTVGEVRRAFELKHGDVPITHDPAARLVKTETIGKDPANQPTPVRTETINPQTGQAVTESSQNPEALRNETPADSSIPGLRNQLIDALDRNDTAKANTLLKAIEDERSAQTKATDTQRGRVDERSRTLDTYSRLGEQRERIAELSSNPSLPSMTGLGGREVSIPIPGTGTSIGGSLSDLSAAVGQTMGLLGLPGGKEADNLAAAKSTWNAIQNSGLIDELQRLKGQSATGATGFGSLTQGERQGIIDAYTGVDPTASAPKFIQALTRLDDRLSRAMKTLESDYKAKTGEDLSPPVPETVKRGQESINKANEAAAKRSLEEQVAAASPENKNMIQQFLDFLTQNRLGTEFVR